MISKEQVAADYQQIQDEICAALEATDGKAVFEEEKWEREGGGGGRTRIIQNGSIFEKGGVNFSAVEGQLPHTLKKALNVEQDDFFATGVSIVIHPQSPMVPIIHMNIRYFEMDGGVKWLGGGIDLTPHYIVEEDAEFFHAALKKVCDKHNAGYYPKFKKWADDYFYISHRKETRGIGGIFFDRLNEDTDMSFEQNLNFWKDVGQAFAPMYTELIRRNKNKTFSEQHKQWQLLRRGRYVEFNLVYDKGTKFGLETNGRVESILMSLPKLASWEYDFKTEKNSEEEKTLGLLKKGIDWA